MEYTYPVYMCFVDLEKPYDRVPQEILWGGAAREWGEGVPTQVRGSLLRAIQSLFALVLSSKSDSLSPILFVIFMDRISRRSRGG